MPLTESPVVKLTKISINRVTDTSSCSVCSMSYCKCYFIILLTKQLGFHTSEIRHSRGLPPTYAILCNFVSVRFSPISWSWSYFGSIFSQCASQNEMIIYSFFFQCFSPDLISIAIVLLVQADRQSNKELEVKLHSPMHLDSFKWMESEINMINRKISVTNRCGCELWRIKWKHFQRYWPFVRVIHRLPVNSPHKGQWRGSLMVSLWGRWFETPSRPLWRPSNGMRRIHAGINRSQGSHF